MRREKVLAVLNDPLAQELISSNNPVRLAYSGSDGLPRVVPLGFHWTGEHFVICTIPGARKVRALEAKPKVAMTIDTTTFPPKVLLVRGAASLELVAGVPPEYLAASKKQLVAEQMPAFETQVRALYEQMVRITIVPEWAKLIDFETRFPSAVEPLLKRAAPAAR
jgi:hypothetical protein